MTNNSAAPDRSTEAIWGSTCLRPASAPIAGTQVDRRAAFAFGMASFFTLVDLFGPQAIGPALTGFYAITPKHTGFILNSAAVGMAAGALLAAPILARLGRRSVMIGVLMLLAAPTLLLATAPPIQLFLQLRVAQGLLMGAGFATAIAFVGDEWGPVQQAAPLMAWYVTGNVAANMLGRMMTGVIAESSGWQTGFLALGCLNFSGGLLLAWFLPVPSRQRIVRGIPSSSCFASELGDRSIVAACAVGFLILFTFIGVFNYANYRLIGEPFDLSIQQIGLLYVVFTVSLLATPLAGPLVAAFGHRNALVAGAAVCLVGSALILSTTIATFMTGLALIGAGTFFCQAVATGFVGQVARCDKAAASGLYLASYYFGGICGAMLFGVAFEQIAWSGFVMLVTASFALLLVIPAVNWPPSAAPASQ